MITWHEVAPARLKAAALALRDEQGGRLVQLLATDERPIDGKFRLYYVFQAGGGLQVLRVPVDPAVPEFPSLTLEIPAAHWYEREIHDLFGLRPLGHPDPRPLVLHPGWPTGVYPLRKDFSLNEWPGRTGEPHLHFHGAEGEGLAQVPVGPIHAGVIEPGHFRFATLGESVIRLEAQLFYTHRGVEKRAEGMSLEQGPFLAERVCGACAASHAAAYAAAVEQLCGATLPPRAVHLRTLALELERLYNHVGDVGNLCAGAAFAFGNSQGLRLKEHLMQLNDRVFGHRFLRGVIVPGGVRRDLGSAAAADIASTLEAVAGEFRQVVEVMLGDGIFMDRVRRTGTLRREVAEPLGVVGVAARASGIDTDLRRDLPYLAYGKLRFRVPVYQAGDVASRLQVRLVEAFESFELVRQLLAALPAGPWRADLPPAPAFARSIGWVESPRGADLHFLMTGARGEIYRYMVRSASYPNWAAVPYAMPGNLVPDFPLINKSFELCYACLDR